MVEHQRSAKTKAMLERLPELFGGGDPASLLARLLDTFAGAIEQAEIDLYRVMRAHSFATADNEGSEGFDTHQKGDLDKIFALYLERLGATALLRQIDRKPGAEGQIDDEAYRQSMARLIGVLREGASTRDGIIDIVAANLGIVGDTPAARAARARIRVEEFQPHRREDDPRRLPLFAPFALSNPNVVAATPEFRLSVDAERGTGLGRPRLVNLATGAYVQYNGSIDPGDTLALAADGAAYLNGANVGAALSGDIPALPSGESQWQLEAELRVPTGRFDRFPFDESAFDLGRGGLIARLDDEASVFDGAVFFPTEPVATLGVAITRLTPGAFVVYVPWNLPGFTDTELFGRGQVDPRTQIRHIVNRVKAAGIVASVAYQEWLGERHDVDERLTLWARWQGREQQELTGGNFFAGSVLRPYPKGLEHAMDDSMAAGGVFDKTPLDHMALAGEVASREEPYPEGVAHDMSDTLLIHGLFDYTSLNYSVFGE